MGTLSLKKQAVGLLFILSVGLSSLRADEGWQPVDPVLPPTPIQPGQTPPTSTPSAGSSLSTAALTAQATVAYPGASPTAVTPELQALATGLDNDPVKIFNYVRNKVAYQHYYGCNKGAHVTYLDGAGNDMDQACLLIALLNQAGYASTSFVYGQISVRDTSADGNSLAGWFGLPAPLATLVLSNAGPNPPTGINFGSYVLWTFDHVWVRVTIGLTTYDLDPSFKQSQTTSAIDFKTASGYSRSQLLTDAGGTTTSAADYIQSLSRSSVETRLSQYASTLKSYIKANYPNVETEQIIGGKQITQQPVADLSAGAPLAAFSPTVTTTFATIPSQYLATYQVKIDSDIDVTFTVAGLQGRRLSMVFSGTNAQLWLGDVASPVAQQSAGSGPTASITLALVHPWSSLNQTIQPSYNRAGSYDLTYALFPSPRSNGQIDASNRQLQTYLASGLTDTSRQVLTETLHGLGLKWARRVALEGAMVAQTMGLYSDVPHIIGRTGQESGYYVDMPGLFLRMFDATGTIYKAFNAATFMASAMEHGDIEQNGGSASLSTIKCLVLANDGGQKIFKATSSNYSTGFNVQSQLTTNSYSSGQKTSFSSSISAGFTLLIHQNGKTTLNQWTGFGYAAISTSKVSMLIGGGYSGGFNSVTGTTSGTAALLADQSSSFEDVDVSSLTTPTSPEPVDLLTGAYTMRHADLTLGQPGSPRGLAFARSYDGSHNFLNSTLGNGWRHSYEGKVTLSSELDNAFGLIQPADAAQTIIGLLALEDFTDTTYTPKELVIGAFAANWTVNRILNNAANVQLGNQRFTYINQPDGSWNPPPGSTTALTGASGTFALQPRFGGSLTFDSQNRLSQWKDADNNTQTLAYNGTTGKLATVTDSFSRTLTFNYYGSGAGSGLLQNVQDSSGRSVQFAYTAGTYSGANLTGITDPENYATTLVYDSRNRLTDWKDNASAVITHNDYDALDRVSQQLSQGLSNHTWKFHYSPGQTLQIDPQNGESATLFDSKGRNVGSIDALAHSSSLAYDGQNHVTLATDATGRQTAFVFDGNQNLTQATDNAGKSTTFLYDASLRLWKVTDPTTRTTVYGYDGENHLATATDPGSRQVQYFYRADGLIDHVIDPAGHTTTFTTYDARGNPTLVTRADGTTMAATYNTLGDRMSATDGRGYATNFTYDKRRLPKTRIDARTGLTQWAYDSNGYPFTSIDRNGKTTTYAYNNLGHIQSVAAPDTDTVTFNYDTCDRSNGQTDGLAHTTSVTHDLTGRVTAVANALSITTAQWTFDNAGRITVQSDGLNKQTQYFYDTVGRLDHTLDPLSHETDNSYDDAGRPLSLKNRRGLTFGFGYSTDGLASTFTYPSSRQSQIVARDAHGLPSTLQSPAGNQTALTYDNMGRVLTVADGVGGIAATYDHEGHATDIVETIGAASTTLHRVFDELGRVTSFTDSQGYTIGYTYDSEGNVKTVVYPGGKTVTYTYDGSNRLKTVVDWLGRTTTYTYDEIGRLQTVARPNNTRQRVSFDNANRLSASYEELMSGTTVIGTLWQAGYGFDNANHLISFTPSPLAKTKAPPAVALTYDSDNQLATYNGQTVGHDSDGNLLAAPVQGTVPGTLVWDVRKRLISAGGATYAYDSENRRVASTTGGQTTAYVYSPGARLDRLLAKINPDGSVTRYVYGAGLLYEETTSAGGTAQSPVYYHFDWRGDTVALSDATGTVTARLSYSPFGERTVESGAVTTPFGFNGQWGVMTEANGLLAMQARFYSPVLKRFLSEDPSGFAGGTNLYAFAGADPVDFLDPFGLGPYSIGDSFALGSFVNPNNGWVYGPGAPNENGGTFITSAFNIDTMQTANFGAPNLGAQDMTPLFIPAIPAVESAIAWVGGKITGIFGRSAADAVVDTAKVNLYEGDGVIAIVQDGEVIAQADPLMGHPTLVEQTFGAGATVPEGAEVITILKSDGEIYTLTSKSIYGKSVPASDEALAAARAVFK